MTRPKKSKAASHTTNTNGAAVDVESHTNETGSSNNNNNNNINKINNPYSSLPEPNVLPVYHPLNILKRSGYIGGAAYGLHKLQAPSAILHSPQIRHEWFKLGLAGTIAILTIKAYVELYQGKLHKRKVNYDNFKQTTHAVLLLMVVTSLAFHVALWPRYGVATFAVLFLLGVILLNTALLIPTYVQNLVSVIFMTFFLQQYK